LKYIGIYWVVFVLPGEERGVRSEKLVVLALTVHELHPINVIARRY
jgi:hypothetical protein